MIWKQLLESFLQQPNETRIQPETIEHLACICINFSPEILNQTLLEALGTQRIARAALVQHLPEYYRATADDSSVCFQYRDPNIALKAALLIDSILAKFGLHCTIALGYGEGIQLEDEWKSVDLLRTKRLTYYINHHEIAVTESFLSKIELIEGVGSFLAPLKLQEAAGFSFWILKDYR